MRRRRSQSSRVPSHCGRVRCAPHCAPLLGTDYSVSTACGPSMAILWTRSDTLSRLVSGLLQPPSSRQTALPPSITRPSTRTSTGSGFTSARCQSTRSSQFLAPCTSPRSSSSPNQHRASSASFRTCCILTTTRSRTQSTQTSSHLCTPAPGGHSGQHRCSFQSCRRARKVQYGTLKPHSVRF
jgi:hypothetical protein